MGEFNKDANQGGFGKEEKGEKPAFGQFEKGQQGQQDFGEEKGQDFGESKESIGKDQAKADGKHDQSAAGQQQIEKNPQRQQGDEDLGDDSIDNQSLK